jgi:FAD:protein FMN transferase
MGTALHRRIHDDDRPPMRAPRPVVSREAALMGGQVGVHVEPAGDRGDRDRAVMDADRVFRRISAWADRLTRFTETSELTRLNTDPRPEVPVGPTMASILDWARVAEGTTGGIVDIGLLDARLSAEMEAAFGAASHARSVPASLASRAWSLDRQPRGAVVRRPSGLRFDLDGVGKGWLADRGLDLLGRYGAAVVDADGDVAIRLDAGRSWSFGVADPRLEGYDLAVLRLTPRIVGSGRDGRFGLATSGTSVHRWAGADGPTHHLIDPRTGRSAATDVIQATVLASSARRAEALAKAVVVLGSAAGLDLLDRVGVDGALLLTDRVEFLIHPATMRWLT